MTKEKWVSIPGFSKYKVSNLGKVVSTRWRKRERLLTGHKTDKGYISVYLKNDDGRYKARTIHRMVGIGFLPNSENLPQLNHKNGIKTDNRVENLEWCNNSHNIKHSYRTGLKQPLVGEQNGFSKLTNVGVRRIKMALQTGISIGELSDIYKVAYSTVYDIKVGKRWTHIKLKEV